MKIFYAVQATGNGHISRAMEILPYLSKYGEVDLFLSGANSSLVLNAPVKYRSKGLCLFYSNSGGLNYWEMAKNLAPLRMLKEVRDLPVDKYDLVLNDFESITAMACALKKVPSVNFGHQASFISDKVPRPKKKDFIGEWILRHYGKATQYLGLHFQSYDDFILPPIIRKDIRHAEPRKGNYLTVYLPSYADANLMKLFSSIKDVEFHIFSKQVKEIQRIGNLRFFPVSKEGFFKSMINCGGIITNAGFETPAEAMYLGKKLMVTPIQGQYEQECNAAALEKMGVMHLPRLDADFRQQFEQWFSSSKIITSIPDHSTRSTISFLMHHCTGRKNQDLDLIYPELIFN